MPGKLCVPLAALALTLALNGCNGSSQQAATPRPVAFPRMELLDTAMAVVEQAAPLTLLANAGAVVEIPQRNADNKGSRWINIDYPTYGATLFCTITSVTDATRQEVIDNRTERMSLNVNGISTEITQIDNAAFHSQLLFTPAGSVTPLQFLSTDSKRWVVSGALYLKNMPRAEAADSIAPVLEAIKSDIITMLSNLAEQ